MAALFGLITLLKLLQHSEVAVLCRFEAVEPRTTRLIRPRLDRQTLTDSRPSAEPQAFISETLNSQRHTYITPKSI